ncbi:MAG: DsbA family oxidoreductase [Inquilinus sp.]|nr:DsbA family oxidoreductase [Inquilinus sp.]
MQIDIFFDVVCPWCFIGKRRMDRAIEGRQGMPVALSWQPFQLNPGMPPDGMDRRDYLAAKFGGTARAAQVYAMVAETAERDGLKLNLEAIERTPSTLDAHRLIRLFTRGGGDAADAVEALFQAYFFDGRDIGDKAELAEIGVDLGFDREEVAPYLDSRVDINHIRAADTAARRMGIQAVPCFVFDRRYALSGAQEPESFFPMFDLAGGEAALSHG